MPAEKMGDLIMVPQIHLAHWTELKVFKELEEVCGSAGGASFSWRTLELDHLC